MLRLTGFFSALAAALFWCWGPEAAGLLYGSAEAGFYLQVYRVDSSITARKPRMPYRGSSTATPASRSTASHTL